MIDLTATEIVTFAATGAGVLLVWALSRYVTRKPRIKSPVFYWACGCEKVPVISDKPLTVRRG